MRVVCFQSQTACVGGRQLDHVCRGRFGEQKVFAAESSWEKEMHVGLQSLARVRAVNR